MSLKNEYWHIYRAAYTHTPLDEAQINTIREICLRNGTEAIYEAVRKKKLIPAVANLMCRLDIDRQFWQPFVEQYAQRNAQVIQCLDEFYQLLTENGIQRIAVVENFGALLASTQPISMFGSGDLDQYADPEERDHIYQVLRDNGYEVEEVRAGKLIISSSARKDSFPEGFCFGINWDVTNRVNLPGFTSKCEFMGWDRCMYYKDTAIRLPSAEGLMYVCLMHIAVHGFCKAPDIRLYYDIANAAQQHIDWQKLSKMAEEDGNCVKIATAAYLANKLLGVDIPEFVFKLGNEKQRRKLLNVVYDRERNILKDFPGRKARILIDVYSDEKSSLHGIKEIIFPKYSWIKAKYGMGIWGYIKHIFSML